MKKSELEETKCAVEKVMEGYGGRPRFEEWRSDDRKFRFLKVVVSFRFKEIPSTEVNDTTNTLHP